MKLFTLIFVVASTMYPQNIVSESDRFSIIDFLKADLDKIIFNNTKFHKKVESIPNKYVYKKIDTLVTIRYKNSYGKKLNGIITELVISDKQLFEDQYFSYGLTKSKFVSQFTDMHNFTIFRRIEDPIVDINDDIIEISSSFERTLTWSFVFKNNALIIIIYETHYE